MQNQELYHHGILGMKWGVIRSKNELARANHSAKKTSDDESDSKKSKKKKITKIKLTELSDDEIREKISRLELEKKYSDLMKNTRSKSSERGKNFVLDVLEKSGSNVATQLVTYGLGSAINKMAKEDIVNPKKGQKDK